MYVYVCMYVCFSMYVFREVRQWMTLRLLKLNDDKTDMIIFISNHHIKLYGVCYMTTGADIILPVD